MMEEKENKYYSVVYIRKYLDGELSGPEMQAMEKAALEDPFLADAIEGMQESLNHPVSFESEMNDLNKRLSDRVIENNKKTGILLFLSNWKIAASFLILIGAAVFTVKYFNNTQEKTIAKGITKNEAEKKATLPETIKTDSIQTATPNSIPDKLKADSEDFAYQPATPEKRSRAKKASETVQPEADKSPASSIEPVVEPAEPAKEKERLSALAKKDEQLPVPTPFLPADNVLAGKAAGVQVSGNKNIPGNYIQGIVTDSMNRAIIGASVKISGTSTNVATDTSGYFKIYLKNSNTSENLVINGIGYDPLKVKIHSDSSRLLSFKLNPSSASLNEVVVTALGISNESDNSDGYYYKREKEPVPDPMGWDSLVTYINTHKKITSTDSLLKGEEIISFVVNSKGELSGFKIIKSLSPAHDTEIIALIKSGPALKILHGKKQKCRISILY